jgi:hypothetical protein
VDLIARAQRTATTWRAGRCHGLAGASLRGERVAIVGEFWDHDGRQAALIWAAVADQVSCVTVIAVANAQPRVRPAGLGGLVLVDGLADAQQALSGAARRARTVVNAAPDRLLVDHRVVSEWFDVRRHIRNGGYRVVFIADRPARLGVRILARTAGWATLQRPRSKGEPGV